MIILLYVRVHSITLLGNKIYIRFLSFIGCNFIPPTATMFFSPSLPSSFSMLTEFVMLASPYPLDGPINFAFHFWVKDT